MVGKVAVVGAGSFTFARRLLADLLTDRDLDGLAIALHDTDAGRLADAEAMARWMAAEVGSPATVTAHAERRAALDGAGYVINVIAVGGRRATQLDFDVPRRHGIRQTIADTLGIGGIFRGLRTIPVVVALGAELAELCPDAYLLNYTNPMTMVPRAVYAATPHRRVVGLCHSVRDTEARLARLVGVPREQCTMVTAGVNHQAWVLTFQRAGEDLYPRLDEVVAADPELRRTVRVELYRRLGFYPTESSEHAAEYVPWFLPHDTEIEHFRIPVGAYPRWLDQYEMDHRAAMRALAAGAGVPIEPTSELASEVIHAIETATPHTVHGSVRNDALITNLPADACVEVACQVDAGGVRPVPFGDLPPQLAAVNHNMLNVGELTLRAALEGRREHVYHAAMLDPHTAARLTLRQIHALVDDLIDAHGDLLPEGIRGPRRRLAAVPPLWNNAGAEPAPHLMRLRNLPLYRWQPRPRLRVAEHRVERARFPAIDAHNHIGRWLTGGEWTVDDVGALVAAMDRVNVRAVVNLDGRWGDELEANLDRYDRAYPGRFATFCHVDWDELATPGFGERLATQLSAGVRAGARGLKVWKDLGLQHRDDRGDLVLLDDERLTPLWATAGELGVPVAVHTADPVAFFDPVDERNERLEQLLAHPEWSFADPAFPRFERLVGDLEAAVAAHPGTAFIGVHVGCYAENLDWVGRMLTRYPNFRVDISARIAELGRQPRAARQLIMRHPDRVLFGTDAFPPSPAAYAVHFRFLETADEHFPHWIDGEAPLMGRWHISGLDLPDDVLAKVYAGNAERLIPALA
jgi:alpha-galactosidase